MSTVRMRHPSLNEEIEVPESAVRFHGSSGWVVVEDPPAPNTEATTEAPEDSGASAMKTTPKRRRSQEGTD